jgi:hypothetical protein
VSYAVFPSSRGDNAPSLTKNEDKETVRKQVAADIAAYLAKGGTITYCPQGESAMDMAQQYIQGSKNSRDQELKLAKSFNFSGSKSSRKLTH